MIKQKEQEGQSCCGGDARVSHALWPVNTRRALATDRMAQRRRQMILILQAWKSFPSFAGKLRSSETPTPDPLVRVLETIDLSKMEVEHLVISGAESICDLR